MTDTDISGRTEISDEGIKKHFKNIEIWGALFELVWNGLDANASVVDVVITDNELDSVVSASVVDDGDGIDIQNIKDNFGRFNDSEKKEDVGQHGLHGRGRLAFHRLCNRATWDTKSASGIAKLTINSANIKDYSGTKIDEASQHQSLKNLTTGTVVELSGFHTNLPTLDTLRSHFSIEFGWYLALHKDKKVRINSIEVTVPEHKIHEKSFDVGNYKFVVKIICWKSKPTSEKSYQYLLNSQGAIVYKTLSSFNLKSNFYTSIYIQSEWANKFVADEPDLFNGSNFTTDSDEWRKTSKSVHDFTQTVYEDFLREYVDIEIEKFIEEGIFPNYGGLPQAYANWMQNHTKEIVKAIYTADPTIFNSLNKKQKKIIVRLIDKIAISNENDAIFEVLNSVLDLDNNSINTLATQLKSTTLENIISTIQVIQQRQSTINMMRTLMNDHYKDVLETPDLQSIIENNTWLFGHRYEIVGAEEDSFTKISKKLRDDISNINDISAADVDDATVEGANKQTDLFLARKLLSHDSFGRQTYRCIIIEIKRPSISLNVKHLRQLDDYAAILKKYPEFSSESMHFELILIGRKISSQDTEIASRLKGQIAKGETGLVSDDDRMKRYVLNWYTLLDNYEISMNFMLKQLELKRDDYTALSQIEIVEALATQQ